MNSLKPIALHKHKKKRLKKSDAVCHSYLLHFQRFPTEICIWAWQWNLCHHDQVAAGSEMLPQLCGPGPHGNRTRILSSARWSTKSGAFCAS